MKPHSSLPANLPPRLLNRKEAAEYVSVSATLFDQLVAAGRMPAPKRLTDRRLAWDRYELDAAIDDLPAIKIVETSSDGWEDVDATQTAPIR